MAPRSAPPANLLPLGHARMAVSPFPNGRATPALQADDLATAPRSDQDAKDHAACGQAIKAGRVSTTATA